MLGIPTIARDLIGEAKHLHPLGQPAPKVMRQHLDARVCHRLIQLIRIGISSRTGRAIVVRPREDLPPPTFRTEVIKLEDLEPGMELSGTVLNVVDFGAFVDIGLPDSGLIHISRLADRFVSDPHEVVSVGDVVNVWVVEVDEKRRRVSLTAIRPGTERTHPRQVRQLRHRGPRQRSGPEALEPVQLRR